MRYVVEWTWPFLTPTVTRGETWHKGVFTHCPTLDVEKVYRNFVVFGIFVILEIFVCVCFSSIMIRWIEKISFEMLLRFKTSTVITLVYCTLRFEKEKYTFSMRLVYLWLRPPMFSLDPTSDACVVEWRYKRLQSGLQFHYYHCLGLWRQRLPAGEFVKRTELPVLLPTLFLLVENIDHFDYRSVISVLLSVLHSLDSVYLAEV